MRKEKMMNLDLGSDGDVQYISWKAQEQTWDVDGEKCELKQFLIAPDSIKIGQGKLEKGQSPIWKWNDSIDKYKKLKKKLSNEQLLFIRYEDLLNDPEYYLRKITQFLGYKYDSKMLDFQNSLDYLGVKKINCHSNLQKPLNTKVVGAWKDRLSDAEIDKIEPMIEENFKFLEYKTT